jgi:S-adenosylmethionine-dependent methyltransferase
MTSRDLEQPSTAASFAQYHQSAASELRYRQAQENLEDLHDLSGSSHVLDAAGGDGINTEYLLRRGHRVTLLDSDPEMLEQARDRLRALDLLDHCRLIEGKLEVLDDILPSEQFDLILCHHVLEYTDQAARILKSFCRLANQRGELSLITLNPVSEVIRAVVFRRDPELAKAKLTDLSYDAKWFGQATLYPMEQIIDWSQRAGWTLRDFRAIRVLADYIPSELTAGVEDEVASLERQLAHTEPYRRFGRYLQFCLAKSPG